MYKFLSIQIMSFQGQINDRKLFQTVLQFFVCCIIIGLDIKAFNSFGNHKRSSSLSKTNNLAPNINHYATDVNIYVNRTGPLTHGDVSTLTHS